MAMAMAAASTHPTMAACSIPTASITASTSVTIASRVAASVGRSDWPVPRLSKSTTRPIAANRSRKCAASGSSATTSRCDTQPIKATMSIGPHPITR